VRGTAQEIADRWASRLGGATTEIAAGIDRVTVAPGQAAAAKADKWEQNTLAAKAKWKARVAGTSLEAWKQAAKTVGVARIAQGANAKKGKMAAFLQEFGPHLDALASKLQSMPDNTFEQRMQRMVAAATHNHTFKRSGV